MKRLFLSLAMLVASLLFTGAATAQDASPIATPAASTALLDALGYPTLEISYDGQSLSAPTELPAGRYRLVVTNTSDNPGTDIGIYGPPEGQTVDQLAAEAAAVDLSGGAPDWYYGMTMLGSTDGGVSTVIDLSTGEWVILAFPFSDQPTELPVLTQPITATGTEPDYPVIDGVIPVTLFDMGIDLPETIDAGPHIVQVTNTGALPHAVTFKKTSGPLTQEEAVNGVKLHLDFPDATPAAAGSPGDGKAWIGMGGVETLRNGGTAWIEVDLEPGTYVAYCYFGGPGDIGLHALEGMTKVFTVE